jgi:hypothetical protein
VSLMCAFCLNLPGRSQGEEAVAWTIVNGTAVCYRHNEFGLTPVFSEALAAAAEWELAMLPGQ